MKRRATTLVALVAVLAALFCPSPAEATALAPFIELQEQGLTLTQAGVGLKTLGGGSANLTVEVGGSVRFALLYWNGSFQSCVETPPGSGDCSVVVQPYGDQQIVFDGAPITGTYIGAETWADAPGGPTLYVGYFADVTSIVAAAGTGTKTFSFSDGNLANNLTTLNGATLLVGYTDPVDTTFYRVLVWDGLDFACATASTAENQTAQAVTFNHGASATPQSAQLYLGAGGASAALPDRVDVSNNPALVNTLDASSGEAWDLDVHTIAIPAGVGTTSVLPVSEAASLGCSQGFWKNNTGEWPATGYSPAQTLESVFDVPDVFGLDNVILLEALSFPGGNNPKGAAQILLRAAVPALLNAAHPEATYPRTEAAVIADVNTALATRNRRTMLALAAELEADNSLGCGLAGSSLADCISWQVAALRVPQVDVTAPTCDWETFEVPQVWARDTIQDTGSGVAEILVTWSENADTVVPPFTVGTTDPVEVTSWKIDPAAPARIEIRVTDSAGNVALCGFEF